jgi:hypothetical protein
MDIAAEFTMDRDAEFTQIRIKYPHQNTIFPETKHAFSEK